MKNDYFNTFEPHDFDISEDLELNAELQTIFVPMEPWFDPDRKFGIRVSNDDNAWVNLYADFNPMTGELHVYYNIDTYQFAYEREYIPTDEEKELFINCIEQACMKQNHMNCREFYIRECKEQSVVISDHNRWEQLLSKAVCYIGESEREWELYDTLHKEIGMSNDEIKRIGFASLSDYFENNEEQTAGMEMS